MKKMLQINIAMNDTRLCYTTDHCLCHTDHSLQLWSKVFFFSILPKCLLSSLCMHISLIFHKVV